MTTRSLFDESQSAALLGLEAIVNFCPEGAEISDCRPQSKEHNNVQCALTSPLEGGISRAEQEQSNGDNLCNHLDFPKFGGCNRESLIGCDETQTVDGNFTPDNDAYHPCGHQIQ